MVNPQKLFNEQEKVFEKLELTNRSNITPPYDYAIDNRICLTLISSLPEKTTGLIDEYILTKLKKIDTNQYYYSPKDFHITVQNIRVIKSPPNFNENDISKVKRLDLRLNLRYKISGISVLNHSCIIRAFPDAQSVQKIMGIRKKLSKIGLQDDKRYIEGPITANITLARFYRETSLKTDLSFSLPDIVIDNISLVSCNAVGKRLTTYKRWDF